MDLEIDKSLMMRSQQIQGKKFSLGLFRKCNNMAHVGSYVFFCRKLASLIRPRMVQCVFIWFLILVWSFIRGLLWPLVWILTWFLEGILSWPVGSEAYHLTFSQNPLSVLKNLLLVPMAWFEILSFVKPFLRGVLVDHRFLEILMWFVGEVEIFMVPAIIW